MIERTFPRGGSDIPHRKEATAHKPIEVLPAPKVVVIPLQQHIGAPCQPLVQKGEKVKMGQMIGEGNQYICAPIHASVSGEVLAVEERPLISGQKVLSVVIRNDDQDEPAFHKSERNVNKLSVQTIRQVVQQAGIVGMGGAGFPTHVKLDPPNPVDTIIVNGAECEPYLTCDHRLMVEKPQEMVTGLLAMMKATGAKKGIIGIEANKPDAIDKVTETISEQAQLSVVVLQVRYPQGAEKQLIKAALNREVPSGKLPCEAGCVVTNVHTAIAVQEALVEGKPSYERVLTVSGGAVVDPRNLLVRIGTPVELLLQYCGGLLGEPAVIVGGGPMTGPAVVDLLGPVVKCQSGIVALSVSEAEFDQNRPCIRCTRCVQVCPVGLTPNLLGEYSRLGHFKKLQNLSIQDCIECGLCSYICPARRGLVTWIKDGKAGLAAAVQEKIS